MQKQHVLDAYEHYCKLICEGYTHNEAIAELDYLHPITLSRLLKYIAAQSAL